MGTAGVQTHKKKLMVKTHPNRTGIQRQPDYEKPGFRRNDEPLPKGESTALSDVFHSPIGVTSVAASTPANQYRKCALFFGTLRPFLWPDEEELFDCLFVGELSCDGECAESGPCQTPSKPAAWKISRIVVPEANAKGAAMAGRVDGLHRPLFST